MEKIKMSFSKATFTLKVNRVKDTYNAVLYMKYASEKALKIHVFPASEIVCPEIENLIGKEVEVKVEGKEITNGEFTIKTQNIFERGVNLDLTLGKDKQKAYLHHGSLILAQMDVAGLPEGLFKRLKEYKVVVLDDEHIRIVRYANLHQHTEYSLLDGIIKTKDLARECEYACAITDHGTMGGYINFYKDMKAAGKKPIIGFEAYVQSPIERIDRRHKNEQFLYGEHLILLAKNQVGLENLCYLSSMAHENVYRHPHVTYEMLENHCDGLVATSACIGGTLGRAIQSMIKAKANPYVAQASLINSEAQMMNAGNDELKNYDEETKEAFLLYANGLKAQTLFLDEMVRLFKDDFYIEIQDHEFELEDMVMEQIKEVAKKRQIPLTVGIDAHYLSRNDASAHEVWLCLQSKTTMQDEKRMRFNGTGYWLHNSDEVIARFKDDIEAVENTLIIAEKCSLEIEFGTYHLPVFPVPDGYTDQNDYFTKLCRQRYLEMFNGTELVSNKEYLARMKFELDTIKNMGWQGYFLIVADYIAWANDDNVRENYKTYFPDKKIEDIPDVYLKDYKILVGPGRGSGAGSLVNYILGITTVDPIKYGLLFERFLNPDRISMPDIDTDFEDGPRGRDAVIQYVKFKYGPAYVSRIITYTTCAARKGILDIARVLGYEVDFARKITDKVPNRPGVTLKQAIKENPEFEEAYLMSHDVKEVVDLAMKFEGLKQHKSVHACGVVISDKPVLKYMPQCLILDKDTGLNEWTSQITMGECEEIGCLKADFLGLRNLGVIHEVLDMINSGEQNSIKYEDVPLFDLNVYLDWKQGQTDGVFQFESASMRGILRDILQDIDVLMAQSELTPQRKEELARLCFGRACDATALGRPGPMAEIPHYVENMLDSSKVTYEDRRLEEILKETNGIIVYQEQTMAIVRALAGFTPGQADNVRKAMGKKLADKLMESGNHFLYGSPELNIKGCINNGISAEDANNIWHKMEDFAKYAFNKSHSYAYTMISAQTGWLAHYYPVHFMTATLNSFISKPPKIKQILSVCKHKKIALLPPDINNSRYDFTVDNQAIRFGLSGLKGIGQELARAIIGERERAGEFVDFQNFVARMKDNVRIDKSILENLILSGSLDSIDNTSRLAKLMAIEQTLEYAKAIDQLQDLPVFEDIPQEWLELKEAMSPKLQIANCDEYESSLLLKHEYEKTGFYISGHPLDNFEVYLDSMGVTETASFSDEEQELEGQYYCKVAGVIKDTKTLFTRKDNKKMAAFTVEDRAGSLNCVIFSAAYAEFEEYIADDTLVLLEGAVENSDFGLKLKVSKVTSLESIKARKMTKVKCHGNSNINVARQQYVKLKALMQEALDGDVEIIFKQDDKDFVIKKIDIDCDTLQGIDAIVGCNKKEIFYD